MLFLKCLPTNCIVIYILGMRGLWKIVNHKFLSNQFYISKIRIIWSIHLKTCFDDELANMLNCIVSITWSGESWESFKALLGKFVT